MGFAIKLLVGGTCAIGIGLWWSVDGAAGGPMNELLGGLVWKGPLLLVAGSAAVILGYRILREINRHGDGPKDHIEDEAH